MLTLHRLNPVKLVTYSGVVHIFGYNLRLCRDCLKILPSFPKRENWVSMHKCLLVKLNLISHSVGIERDRVEGVFRYSKHLWSILQLLFGYFYYDIICWKFYAICLDFELNAFCNQFRNMKWCHKNYKIISNNNTNQRTISVSN